MAGLSAASGAACATSLPARACCTISSGVSSPNSMSSCAGLAMGSDSSSISTRSFASSGGGGATMGPRPGWRLLLLRVWRPRPGRVQPRVPGLHPPGFPLLARRLSGPPQPACAKRPAGLFHAPVLRPFPSHPDPCLMTPLRLHVLNRHEARFNKGAALKKHGPAASSACRHSLRAASAQFQHRPSAPWTQTRGCPWVGSRGLRRQFCTF